MEFLRDEINGNPANLTLPAEAYIVQTDAFFAQMAAWGDTIRQLWKHNRNLDGAKPFLMTQASFGQPGEVCAAPTPTLLSATAGDKQVTVAWTAFSGDPDVQGYTVYYDQAGKA